MPSTSNRNLTLTEIGDNVAVTVSYNATFTPLELHLGTHGLRYRERIAILGVDPPNATTGTVLHNFPSATFQPVNGVRTRTRIVPRASLNEEINLADDNEIRARISLEVSGLPVSLLNQFTDQEILPGIGFTSEIAVPAAPTPA